MDRDLKRLLERAETETSADHILRYTPAELLVQWRPLIGDLVRELRNQEQILGDQGIDLLDSDGYETGRRRGEAAARLAMLALVPASAMGPLLDPHEAAQVLLTTPRLLGDIGIHTARDLLDYDAKGVNWRIGSDYAPVRPLIERFQDAVRQFVEDGMLERKPVREGRSRP